MQSNSFVSLFLAATCGRLRGALLGSSAALLLASAVVSDAEPATDSASADAVAPDPVLDQLADAARRRAMLEYAQPDSLLPPALAALDYDGHRDIRCLPENFLWHGTNAPFRVQFRHRGWLFKENVLLSTVTLGGDIEPLPFAPQRFTYGPIATQHLDPAALPAGLGYAGIALHKVAPENEQTGEADPGRSGDNSAGDAGGDSGGETFNEFLSIQGASYFRAIGFGQHWGSSARGIAINTALNQPEEFPRWLELWIKQPAPALENDGSPGEESITLYGLLDGPSVSGAYKFVITPGQTTSMQVEARLHFRAAVGKLGLAPVTGMFLFGEESPGRFGDYRPEVHDADGLLMQRNDDELDWRPLRNPARTRVSRFGMTDPKGFGLIQRDRNFNHYEDLETEMQIRPSIWVTPGNYRYLAADGDGESNPETAGENSSGGGSGWGEGSVELFEIASDDEGIDNIGAYWVPANEAQIGPGSAIEISYRLDFTQDDRPTPRRVMAWNSTRTIFGEGGDEEANAKSLVRTAVGEEAEGRPVARFIIDTAPGTALPSGTIVRHDVAVTHGQIAGEPVIQYNKFNHAYRLFFDVIADGEKPVELRATLRGATSLDEKKERAPEGTYDDVVDPDTGPPLSETWLYRWDLP